MKQTSIFISTVILLVSCSNNTSNQESNVSEVHSKEETSSTEIIPEKAIWADEYILEYLEAEKGRLIQNESCAVTYIKDIIIRNGKEFAQVKIGRNSEHRFITNQLIFIDSLTKEVFEYDSQNDSLILWLKHAKLKKGQNEIPPNGTYIFDAAFAEWQGKPMGVKVALEIKGDSVKVTYRGGGDLTAEIGDILDEGLIIKHKSGDWIIGSELSDKNLDEIGGCTGGPAIIDFKNKKFWMC